MSSQYHVVYEDEASGDIRNYCLTAMPLDVATKTQLAFNARYPGKPYPNGKGHYPFTPAWIEEAL